MRVSLVNSTRPSAGCCAWVMTIPDTCTDWNNLRAALQRRMWVLVDKKLDTSQHALAAQNVNCIPGCINRGVAAGRRKGLSLSALPHGAPAHTKGAGLLEQVQSRATEMTRRLEHLLSCEKGLKELCMFSLEKALEKPHCSRPVLANKKTGRDSKSVVMRQGVRALK